MMAAHHQHQQHHQQLMWHARSFESGIGINDRAHSSHLHFLQDYPLVGSRNEIYSRIRQDDKKLLPRLVTSPGFTSPNATNPIKIITASNQSNVKFCCMAQAHFQQKRSKSDINIQLRKNPYIPAPHRKYSAHNSQINNNNINNNFLNNSSSKQLYRICELPYCQHVFGDGIGIKSKSIESFVSHNNHHHNHGKNMIDDDYSSHAGRFEQPDISFEKENRDKFSAFVDRSEKPRTSSNPIYVSLKQ
jgi:hypothetical protein